MASRGKHIRCRPAVCQLEQRLLLAQLDGVASSGDGQLHPAAEVGTTGVPSAFVELTNSVEISPGFPGGPPSTADSLLLGRSVTGIGDLDGDGVADVAVGATLQTGGVFVLFMNADGSVKEYQKIGNEIGGGPALNEGDRFGISVASIGDFDGDAVQDLVVGAVSDSLGRKKAGAVYLLLLNSDGTAKRTSKIMGEDDLNLRDDDQFGVSVAPLGDMNRDGVIDFAVGADARRARGAVFILLMNADGTVKIANEIGFDAGAPLALNDRFGKSMSALGDQDRDGVTELVVTASGDDTGGRDRGALYVLWLNPDGHVKRYTKIANGLNEELDLAGTAWIGPVSQIGDLDGDGTIDLAMGNDVGRASADAMSILFMNSDMTVRQLARIGRDFGGGPDFHDYDFFGRSVSPVGDLNGDGVTDLAIGTPGDDNGRNGSGAIHIIMMNADGTAKAFQKISSDTSGGPSLHPTRKFGTAVASLGDLDGDGVNDLAVGAPEDGDGDRPSAGAVFALLMNRDGTVNRSQKITHEIGGGPHLPRWSYFGRRLTGLGDLDGDGVPDLAVAAPESPWGGRRGTVYVLMMNRDGTAREVHPISKDTPIDGLSPEDFIEFGWGMSVIDDLDGDGVQELVARGRASVHVLFLNRDGTVKRGQKISEDVGGGPPNVSIFFGSDMAAIGDLDGDGVSDLAVGDSSRGRNTVYVMFMNRDGTVRNWEAIIGGHFFGKAVSALGDLDGDGITDLAVGASDGPEDQSSVHFMLLNSDGTVKRSTKVTHPQVPGFGGALAFLGDQNQDGGVELASGDGKAVHVVSLSEVVPQPLRVTSVSPTSSGIVADFDTQIDTGKLSLNDTADVSDFVLQGESTGVVEGALVVDRTRRRVTFIKTGGPLEPDRYSIVIKSGENGFVTASAGEQLDGDGDGTGGDDFTTSFVVAEPPEPSITIGLPDFVRGPGEHVNVPPTVSTGLPFSISNGAGVKAIDVRVSYDPELLEITDAVVGADVPVGAGVAVNTVTPGLTVLSFYSVADLPVGDVAFVHLQATVPDNARTQAGERHILKLHDMTISDGLDNEFHVVADQALHVTTRMGDVSGDGRVTASDASLVARYAALLETDFRSATMARPLLFGDVSGDGRVSGSDASMIARMAAGLSLAPEPLPAAGETTIRNLAAIQLGRRLAFPEQIASMAVSRSVKGPPLFDGQESPLHYHAAVDQALAGNEEFLSEASDDIVPAGLLEDGFHLKFLSLTNTRPPISE